MPEHELEADRMLKSPPSVFVSYSWDGEAHRAWVRSLAERLRRDGTDAKLDQWEMAPGDQIPEFMEGSIRDNDFVVVICTPRYKARADGREGGVGYEGDIMTAEVMTRRNRRKFIPVWRSGRWEEAAPSWLVGAYRIDLTDDPYDEKEYQNLLSTLRGEREKPSPVSGYSSTTSESVVARATSESATDSPALKKRLEDIRIVKIISEEVTHPRNDGTRGSALYTVPFLLSGSPRTSWSRLFVKHWNRPASFTTRHRSGIAHVSGNRILLEGTTIEEVDEVHLTTLQLAIDAANREYREIAAKELMRQRAEEAERAGHRRKIDDVAFRMTFD